jgi:multidrug resistance efflux pump
MIKKTLGYGFTLAVAAAGGWIVWGEYQHYADDPWTRDAQVRPNVVGIAPRVAGPIIRIAVVDNQHVKKGDLLFEIDPAQFGGKPASRVPSDKRRSMSSVLAMSNWRSISG